MLRSITSLILLLVFLGLSNIIVAEELPMVEEVDRGQLLYENHCQKCHDSSVHLRENKKANTLVKLSKWIIRWQHHLELNWSFQDVRDVMYFMNSKYYKIPEQP